MNKIIIVMCICCISISLVACNRKSTEVPNSDNVVNGTTSNENTPSSTQQNTTNSEKVDNNANENIPFFNEELQQYEIIDGYSEGFLEIIGEKVNFSGKSYDEISSPLDERIMFNAVRFFITAASGDMNTIEKMADEDLYKEVENALVEQKDSLYVLGGDFAVRIKELSKYEKPISISAPTKIKENEFIITMEYLQKDNKESIEAKLNIAEDGVKVISFLGK